MKRMLQYDFQYQNVIRRILSEGKKVEDRTGVGTLGIFDVNLRVDLSRDDHRYTLPALGLRQVYPRTFWLELFWMLSGSLDARELQSRNVRIWDGNSSREYLDSRGLKGVREGFIGSAGYGKWFRAFDGVDQLAELIFGLDTNPYGRRHVISLWHPAELQDAALPACHVMYNFMVEPGEGDEQDILHLKFFQRSSDWILAGNSNFMFSAFFLSWLADRLGFKVGTLAHSITNCHIYMNHVEVAEELLERKPIAHVASFLMPKFEQPDLFDDYLDIEISDMFLDGWDRTVKDSLDYKSHEKIDPSRLFMAV